MKKKERKSVGELGRGRELSGRGLLDLRLTLRDDCNCKYESDETKEQRVSQTPNQILSTSPSPKLTLRIRVCQSDPQRELHDLHPVRYQL